MADGAKNKNEAEQTGLQNYEVMQSMMKPRAPTGQGETDLTNHELFLRH